MKIKTPLLLTALSATTLLAGQTQAQVAAALRPVDTASPSAGLNLTSYTNAFQGDAESVWNPSFAGVYSPGDAFAVMNRTDSVTEDVINQTFNSTIPYSLADDSISVYPADTAGIVDENDTAPFFGATDTINGSNSGLITASWVFDISAATSDVSISVDLAAMGDFEANDTFIFSVGLDGATPTPVGTFAFMDTDEVLSATDPAFGTYTIAPAYEYTLASGTTTKLNDPMQFNGTTLNNIFSTFSLGTIAGSASASSLTFEFTADTDGGSEGLAFRNIIIDEAGGPAIAGDTDGDGDVDDSDLGTSFANYTGPSANGGKTAAQGDTDGDGDVDDSDLGTSFANYTGPLSPAAVPEPTSLALLGLGGLLVARRRRA